MFYDALDKMRNDMLKQEYEMRAKMDAFEKETRDLVSKLSTYSLIEFYHEENTLFEQIQTLKTSIDDFNIYLPQT